MARRASMRAIRAAMGAALMAAVLGGPAQPVMALTATTCVVTNTGSGVAFTTLAGAVKAASGGDTLTVRGVCRGTTRIAKDVRIKGIRPGGAAYPMLDGRYKGAVLDIRAGAKVTIRDLIVRHGIGASGGFGTSGGGLLVLGTATLRNVTVRDNSAFTGGGIAVAGSLTLADGSQVYGNSALVGGGIYIVDGGFVRMKAGVEVSGNHADTNGGGVVNADGATLAMEVGASIHDNDATTRAGGLLTNGITDGVVCAGLGQNVRDNTAPSDADCGS